jgi:hypothetical protein
LVRSLFHFDSGLSIIGPRSEGASFCGGGVGGEENGSISQQKLVVALTWSISTISRGSSGGSTISSVPCTLMGWDTVQTDLWILCSYVYVSTQCNTIIDYNIEN